MILFVGDGMGVSTVTAARILAGQRRGEPGEEKRLCFETLPQLALPTRAMSAGSLQGRPKLSNIDTTGPTYLQQATVPMAQETHAGEDVPIYAGGTRSALFHGLQEQS